MKETQSCREKETDGARRWRRAGQPLRNAFATHCIHKRSEEHTSELQSQSNLVCRLLLEKKKILQLVELRTRRLHQEHFIISFTFSLSRNRFILDYSKITAILPARPMLRDHESAWLAHVC